jgi:hypothetical protein
MFLEVAHDQQRLHRAAAILGRPGDRRVHDGSLMSIALRSPSLSRLKHSEVMTIADRRPLPANGVDDDFRRFFSQLLCEAVA